MVISASDFTNAGGKTISVSNLTMRLLDDFISLIVGNTKPVTQFADFSVLSTTPQTFVSATPNTGMGSYSLSPDFQLVVPSSTFSGEYQSTFTVEIVSGP